MTYVFMSFVCAYFKLMYILTSLWNEIKASLYESVLYRIE